MKMPSRTQRTLLLAGCFWLLLGQVSPKRRRKGKKDICWLPPETGDCKAAIPSWYYNRQTQTCNMFIYGGCGGNANNFESQEECEDTCQMIKKRSKPCLSRKDIEECKSALPYWYYSRDTQTCEKVEIGGCPGHAKSFQSKVLCEKTCQVIKSKKDICWLPPETGDCKAAIPSWYYNRQTQTCNMFIYGGCGGNANNFESQEECEDTCQMIKRVPGKCQLQKDFGPCHRCILSYFFNLETMRCERFCYSGCKGNGNRFVTKSSCMSYCMPGGTFW